MTGPRGGRPSSRACRRSAPAGRDTLAAGCSAVTARSASRLRARRHVPSVQSLSTYRICVHGHAYLSCMHRAMHQAPREGPPAAPRRCEDRHLTADSGQLRLCSAVPQ